MGNFKEKENISQAEILILVISVESVLFIIGLIWGYFAHINPFKHIYLNFRQIIFAFINALLLIGFNILALTVLSKYFWFFKKLKDAYEDMAYMAANITIFGALITAILSGFAEEFFFRGILQTQAGIAISSIVFGLFHIGNAKTIWYGAYTVLIGLYLGWLYLHTGNLLVPILVHILNNFLAFPYMRWYYKKNLENNI